MACQSEEKGKVGADSVNKRFGPGSAAFIHCDLASFSSICQSVEPLSQENVKLSALVNNAVTISYQRQTTADGLELQLGVNHLGHFLLTHLLLPQMDWEGLNRPPYSTFIAFYFFLFFGYFGLLLSTYFVQDAFLQATVHSFATETVRQKSGGKRFVGFNGK